MPAPTKGTILPLEDKPTKRCRKWRVRKRTGRNPATGRYSERNRVVYGTYSDAEEELEKLNAEVADMRTMPKKKSITVEEMFDEFYAVLEQWRTDWYSNKEKVTHVWLKETGA